MKTSGLRVLAMMEAASVTGPAKNLLAFAAQAPALGVDLSVVTFERRSAAFCAALEEHGVPYDLIAEKHAGDLGVVPQLRRILASKQPDIVQTHNTKSHFLLRTVGAPRGTRWIAFHHGFTSTDWKDRSYNRLGRWALKGAPHVVAVCGAFARELAASGIAPDRLSICHNSVLPFAAPPPGELADLKESLGIPSGALVVLAVGRLSKEKGHLDLLSAAALLRAACPTLDFRLLFVGEGPERQPLERTASTLGMADRLLLPGQRKDIRAFYGIADVFALPSHSEGSPNALLEAMTAGLPIVATAVGGSTELVSNEETALVAKARDPQSLCDSIGRLLCDRALAGRLGASAELASRQYTPQAYAQRIVEIYRRVRG